MRSHVRALLRGLIDSIAIEIGTNRYSVAFKGGKQPVLVTIIRPGEYCFSPAPSFVLGQPVPAGLSNVM